MEDAALGRMAAGLVWKQGLKQSVNEVLTREFADAAIAEFRSLQEEHHAGIIGDFLDGAEKAAEQLNVERYHGVLEVVQNADDLGAGELRIAVRSKGRGKQLLFCHDGNPIDLRDTIAMAVAFLSTKRDDPRMKGKFGIGLKTLQRLGARLAVHCSPYHFEIEKGLVRPCEAEASIAGFYGSASRQTLMVVSLLPGFDPDDFRSWLTALGAEAMLFLDALSCIKLIDARTGKTQLALELRRDAAESALLSISGRRLKCEIVRVKETRRRRPRSWTTYCVELPIDKHAARSRTHKATAGRAALSIAIPGRVQQGGVFAGLPTRIKLGTPFSLNAEFDPDTSRDTLLHNDWNEWLFEGLSNLALAVALRRFKSDPVTGWIAVGISEEAVLGAGRDDDWLIHRMARLVQVQRSGLTQSLRLPMGRAKVPLSDLAFECRALEGLLSEADIGDLSGGEHALRADMRDGEQRWRSVLEDLGQSTCIEVSDAVQMFGWGDSPLGRRTGAWFVRLAARAMEASCQSQLLALRCLLLADGSRVRPYSDGDGILVSMRQTDSGLGARLGVIRVADPAYSADHQDSVAVREFLKGAGSVVDKPHAADVLAALASWKGDIELADDDIVELRGMLDGLETEEQVRLAGRIGRVVLVEGRIYEKGSEKKVLVHPANAYLPPSIEKTRTRDGWAKVAAHTPGLQWIHPRYGSLIQAGSERDQTGAARFFGMLGAERAPRLVQPINQFSKYGQPAYPIQLDDGNRLQLREVDTRDKQSREWATHLIGDWESPDLLAVARDIAAMKPSPKRRDRARGLIAVLDRAWFRLYEDRSQVEAVYGYYDWISNGLVSATWASRLASVAWLTDRSRPARPLAPIDAKVRTDLNVAIHGDDARLWAAEITSAESRLAITSALGVEGDPSAQTLLHRLEDWRASGGERGAPAIWAAISKLYVGLAAHCSKLSNGKWASVDNVAPAELRRAFTTHELVFSGGGWHAPRDVYRGAAMFGDDKAVVPSNEALDPLWDLLGIETPSAEECIAWLRKLSKPKHGISNAALVKARPQLVEVYRHLFSLAPQLPPKTLRALRSLPLRCGDRWVTDRPVFACYDPDIAEKLASKAAPVWTPPCSLEGLRTPVADMQIEVLDESAFVMSGVGPADWVRGEPLAARMSTSVERLRENLADKDAILFRSFKLRDWHSLQTITLAVAPDLALSVKVSGKPYKLPGRALLSSDPLMLAVAEEEDLGTSELGGRQIATLFDVSDRDRWTIALAWAAAWRSASDRHASSGLDLVDEIPDWASTPDEPAAPAPSATVRKKRRQPELTESQVEKREQKVLKEPSALVAELEEAGGEWHAPGGVVVGKKKPLARRKPQEGRPKRDAKHGSTKAYGAEEREEVGYRLLESIVWELSNRALVDCRSETGRGADAVDEDDRCYYELKVHGGSAPDRVSLTRSEAERALEKRGDYYLVIVSGVDEGQETRLTMIPDPLRKLDWHPTDDVKVGGYQAKKFRTWRFRQIADSDGAGSS